MRIAFFVDRFPCLSETFILNQITGLIDRGHQVDIYCDRSGNIEQMHPEVEKYRLLQCTYNSRVPINNILHYLKGICLFLFNFPQAPFTLINSVKARSKKSVYGDIAIGLKPLYLTLPLLKQPSYDLIHCHYGRNGLKAILLKDLGIIDGKIVTAFHGYDISFYLKMYGEDVYNYLFQRGDLFQPISHLWAKKLIALGCNLDKIVVHHMGIDSNKFTLTPIKDTNPESINLVSIARLVEKKGLCYGIDAVARLLNKCPQLKLQYYIIGDGVLRTALQQQIDRLKLTKQVKLLGWKTQQQVQTIIDQADIVIAPSITSSTGDCEGIPISLMETMAQAIPVISTYHSGIPELVEDGVTGYLVPEKDVPALTDKLEQLINNPSLRRKMGLAGRTKVLNDYNIELLCDRLVEIYRHLINHADI